MSSAKINSSIAIASCTTTERDRIGWVLATHGNAQMQVGSGNLDGSPTACQTTANNHDIVLNHGFLDRITTAYPIVVQAIAVSAKSEEGLKKWGAIVLVRSKVWI